MPSYDYRCDKCNITEDVFHAMSDNSTRKCPKCKKKMEKQIGMGYFASKGFKPTLADLKENDHKKKVKDPDRARRNRIKAFGSADVGTPVDKPDPRHILKQGRVKGGREMEVDKKDIIKTLSKDPLSVKLAQDSLKKARSKT